MAIKSLGVAHVSRGSSLLSPHIDGEYAAIAECVARMALTGINQDCRRDAANIACVKTLRDDDAEVFEAILRSVVGLTGADENVVTVAAVTRTEGRKPIVPIIATLALVEATGGDHGKLVGVFAGLRAFLEFKAPSVAGVQTVQDALAAVLD